MEQVTLLVQQLLKMFVYMCVGFLLVRGGVLKKGESRVPAQMLLYVFLPCTIVNSFYTGDRSRGAGPLMTSILLGAAALIVAMAISALLFRKRPIDNFSGAFSNAGFMGIPLIGMILGAPYVIYIAGMVAMLNALQWTYGQMILSGEKRVSTRALLTNPMIVAFALGLIVFFLPVRLPDIAETCLGGMAACNTPLAMIVLGLYLGESDLRRVFSDKRVYLTCAVRLLLVPIVTVLVLKLIPAEYELRTAIILAACAPVGSNVAIYAQKLKLDHAYAVGLVCASTVLSIVTIPAVIYVAGLIG